jgi:hypothetical protein
MTTFCFVRRSEGLNVWSEAKNCETFNQNSHTYVVLSEESRLFCRSFDKFGNSVIRLPQESSEVSSSFLCFRSKRSSNLPLVCRSPHQFGSRTYEKSLKRERKLHKKQRVKIKQRFLYFNLHLTMF